MSRLDDLDAKYRTALIAELVRFGRPEADAQDIAQKVLIQTWKRLDDVSVHGEWYFLRKAAHNLARNAARDERAARRGGGLLVPLEPTHDDVDGSRSAETNLIVREEVARFRRDFGAAVDSLEPDMQQALTMRSRDVSTKEIARLLGIGHSALRARLSRAIAAIRARVGKPPAGVEWFELLGDDE